MKQWLQRQWCRWTKHNAKQVGSFSGGSSYVCLRCGATGSSFEQCPSVYGDASISWHE